MSWLKTNKEDLWQLQGDPAAMALYIYCVLNADHDDTYYNGEFVPRGSFITSLSKICRYTGLSEKIVRTLLEGTIKGTIKVTKRAQLGTLITLSQSKCYGSAKTKEGTSSAGERAQVRAHINKTIENKTIEKKEDKSSKESARLIYDSYPTRDPGNGRKIAKSLKDIDTIVHLIDSGTYTADQLQRTINLYLEDHKTGYVQNLKTFLNNIPDYGTAAVEQPKEEQPQSKRKKNLQKC